ncbi:lipopolysaccharide heptosyltransferase family protein [Flavobacterium sp. NST-5]|uniref:Lipopolysaccharide heptosyltransferase family protein n=1 Tax=Flavobacterium ichthyis TaxID=2698827 RepID=A0ABW9Z8T1_9FLAO|nr:glycosyltransferase family 9 protein [Flavobacterium ichthyis]NBL65268.1 lipopolysaccharide heptosyltransferase family protein [Flavobacterium ichthyis]
MKILVIQMKMIGDVLVSSIICNNLKSEYPNAQIDYLIYPFTVPVVENNPNIDNLILFEEKYSKSKWQLLQFILKIRKQKYDIVIDAYGKLESAIITKFSGASKRIGYRQKEKLNAYNIAVDHHDFPKSYAGLAIERRENLFKDLMTEPIENHPKLFVTAKEKQDAYNIFLSNGINPEKENVLMLSILGSDLDKTYPEKYLVKLIELIAKQENIKLLFNYMPKQFSQAKAIYDQCSQEARDKIKLEIIGENLRSFMGLMWHCKMMIGNDGGAVNMAKALNKPTFTIFSPWIQKESWSIFEDGNFHKAVHLKDFAPQLFSNVNRKTLRKNYQDYYKRFEPLLIQDSLITFLNTHLPQHNV